MATYRPAGVASGISSFGFGFAFVIEWSKLDEKETTAQFVTVYKNVPIPWTAKILVDKEKRDSSSNTFSLYIYYDDRFEMIADRSVSIQVEMIGSDGKVLETKRRDEFNPNRDRPVGWDEFARRDFDYFNETYGVPRSDTVKFLVSFEIPVPWEFVFFGDGESDVVSSSSSGLDIGWAEKQRRWFDTIEDSDTAPYYDVKLEARDRVARWKFQKSESRF